MEHDLTVAPAGGTADPVDAPPRWRTSMRLVPWRWADVAIGLAPLVLVRAGSAWLGPDAVPEAARRFWLPLNVLMQLWMVGYPLWVARRRGVRLPRPSVRYVAIEAAFAAPTMVVIWMTLMTVVVIWTAAAGPVRPQNPLAPLFRSGDRATVAALVLMAVVVAPVVEEVFFRGMVFNALRRTMHPVPAALIQAAAFGLLHSFGLVHAALASLLGLALAAVYTWRRTLIAPIIIHALQNASAAALTFLMTANAPILGINGEEHGDGCLVTAVHPGMGAAAAGLAAGDVITTVDGQPVWDIEDVAAVVRDKRAGNTVRVEFVRDGAVRVTSATLGTRPGP